MTLNQLLPGQKALLQELPEGLVRSQAIRLGLMPGTEIVCVHKLPRGPVIIKKNKQQIAIGEALAARINVKSTQKGESKGGKEPQKWN